MKARGLIVFTLALIVLWAGLGSYGLVEPSDARYAEIAREMNVSGDHVFPRLLGISHFHKPPLIFWLSSLGYEIFGVNEWGARAPLALCGFILVTVVWTLASRLVGTAAAPWAALILITTPAVIAGSRILTTDLLLATSQTVMLGTWFSLHAGSKIRGARFSLYIAAGLAFLAKGPVAWIVPTLIVVIFSLLDRKGEKKPPGYWGVRWGLPLALFLTVWAVVPPIFFSLPSTKLPLYPLVAYPATALLAAAALREGSEPRALAPRLAGGVFVLLGAAAAVAALSPVAGKSGDLMAGSPGTVTVSLLVLAAICLAGGAGALIYSGKRRRKAALALVATTLVLPLWFFAVQESLPLRSVRKVGLAAREMLNDDDVFVEYRALASGLPFYAGRMPMLAWIPRDVRFDGPEVQRRVVTLHEMQQIWSGRQRVVVVTRDRHLVDLPGARKIAAGGGYVLAVSPL